MDRVANVMNIIVDWLMPREYRAYWAHWFIYVYFMIGVCIHCPEVARAILWPFLIIHTIVRG